LSSDDHEAVKKDISVSRVECKVTIRGKGEFVVELYKHLAPITVNAIMRALPMSSRVTIYPRAMVCVLTGIKTGVEKQRFEYSKGEIAFLAANGSICFFTANVKSASPLNPVGKLKGNLEVLDRLTAGDVMELSQALDIGAQI
jgi:uncharacterized protein